MGSKIEKNKTSSKSKMHKYRDFSEMTDKESEDLLGNDRKPGRVQESFPVKLHLILERSEIDGYSSILSWVRHGRAFKIHDQKIFTEKLMPRFFYQTMLSSF